MRELSAPGPGRFLTRRGVKPPVQGTGGKEKSGEKGNTKSGKAHLTALKKAEKELSLQPKFSAGRWRAGGHMLYEFASTVQDFRSF